MTDDFDSDPPEWSDRMVSYRHDVRLDHINEERGLPPIAGPWLARRIGITIVVIAGLVSLAVALWR